MRGAAGTPGLRLRCGAGREDFSWGRPKCERGASRRPWAARLPAEAQGTPGGASARPPEKFKKFKTFKKCFIEFVKMIEKSSMQVMKEKHFVNLLEELKVEFIAPQKGDDFDPKIHEPLNVSDNNIIEYTAR